MLDAEVAWHVEFDRAPSRILDHHWPDVPNYGDVTKCDWAAMPPVDIITGGSPCQDLSAAGRRAGMTEGTRSNLWVNMREAIATIRPRYVIWENVLGALSATAASASDMVTDTGPLGNPGDGHLRALGRVLGDLAEIGYDARWTTLRASDIGAPHHRARVFLLATPAEPEGSGRDHGSTTHYGPTDREVNAPRDDHDSAAERGCAVPADADSIGRGQGAEQPGAGAQEVAATVGDLGALPGDGRADDLLVLPTPAACNPNDGEGTETWLRRRDEVKARVNNGNGMGMPLTIAVQLLGDEPVLPTPTVGNATGTNERRGGKRSDELLLPGVAAAHAAGAFLPTPVASEAKGPTRPVGRSRSDGRARSESDQRLPDAVAVFPTPTTSEATGGKGPESRRSGGEYLREVVTGVLPSPTASDASGGGLHPDHPGRQGHTMQLPDYVLLADEPDRWGKYAPAIHRWERIVGPAPAPTEPNKNGKPRLNAAFASWMMGLPEGWVTAPDIGISRAEQLKAIGNGVCPQQAAAALRELFAMPAGEAA